MPKIRVTIHGHTDQGENFPALTDVICFDGQDDLAVVVFDRTRGVVFQRSFDSTKRTHDTTLADVGRDITFALQASGILSH